MKICKNCQQPIQSTSRRSFCSDTCYQQIRNKIYGQERECDHCHKKYIARNRPLRSERKGYFCSKKCFYESRKNNFIPANKKYDNPLTTVTCAICSKTFQVKTGQYHARLRKGKTRFACSPECKHKLQSITIKEVRSTPESRAKTVAQCNQRWSDPAERKHYGALMAAKSPAWHQARITKSRQHVGPTKPEQWLIDFLAHHKLPFKYVGNGQLWIGQLNPDFTSIDNSKRLIEVFGCYHHGCQRCFPGSKSRGIPLNQRLSTFKKYGYDMFIIWQHELSEPTFENKLLRILSPNADLVRLIEEKST